MLNRITPSLLLLLLASTFACRHQIPRSTSDLHSDSGVRGGTFDEISAQQRQLVARYPNLLSLNTYGRSVANRPLLLLRLARPQSGTPASGERRPAVALTQTVHGNEYLGVVDHLAGEFLAHPETYPEVHRFLDRGGIFYFIPVVNPDGYEASRRTNDGGKDLNRDFEVVRYTERVAMARRGDLTYTDSDFADLVHYVDSAKFTQPESRALADAIRRQLTADQAQLKMSIDYHCCQDSDFGSLMHEWGDTKALGDGDIRATDVTRYEAVAALFRTQFPDHIWGSGYQIINYLTFGTTDEWFYESFMADGVLAFCYEGQSTNENRKLAQHAKFWDALLTEDKAIVR